MAKPGARSILYRLIEAAQLARRALLVRLRERGLEPGDDAILFLLHQERGAGAADVAAALGIDGNAFASRIARLVGHDLVEQRATGPALEPGLQLTRRGRRVCRLLEDYWSLLEGELTDGLGKKQRDRLRKTLGRFIVRLNTSA
jgi:DNA-binding MarR family transcriptional regulator